MNADELPFAIREFTNEHSTSFRVDGYLLGKRIRKNFADRAIAENFCKAKNDEALSFKGPDGPVRAAVTRLSDADLVNFEGALTMIRGRWPLIQVIEAGIGTLSKALPSELVLPLAEQWLKLMEQETSDRWHGDLRARIRLFLRCFPNLKTSEWDTAFTRAWLDGLDLSKTTRANYRNALHRFGGWLVERGFCAANPAGGIRIANKRSADEKATLPTILRPVQAEALMRAFEAAECRRLIGWAGCCLFAGLRPLSEAPRQVWAELNFKTGELMVIGRKRGVKTRIVKLQPTALAWLKVAKADRMPIPGRHLVKVRRRAVEIANESLAEKIVWDEDILRHTAASFLAGLGISIADLAEMLGTSTEMIVAHYRHPRPAAEVKAFWAILPR